MVPGNATTMPRHPTQNKPTGFSCRYFVKRVEHSRTSTSITFQCIANRKTLSARSSFIVSRSGKSIILRVPWKMKKSSVESMMVIFFRNFFSSQRRPFSVAVSCGWGWKSQKKNQNCTFGADCEKKLHGGKKSRHHRGTGKRWWEEKKQRRREEWDAAKKQN